MNLKDAVVETIRRMPENATARDIIYEIYLIDNVIDGLKASEEDKTISTEELLKKVIMSLLKDVSIDIIGKMSKDSTAKDMIYEIIFIDLALEKIKDFRKFHNLAKVWKEETKLSSFPITITQNPSYLEIIGMGEKAIPFILRDLTTKPNHWFVALRAITGISPIEPSHKGDIIKMSEDWISWGKENGYI